MGQEKPKRRCTGWELVAYRLKFQVLQCFLCELQNAAGDFAQFCLIVYQDMKWIMKALPDADIAHCCVTANEQLQEPRIWLNFLYIGLTLCSNSMQWRGVYQQSRRVKHLSHSATTKLHHSNISVVANYISICLLELTSGNSGYAQKTH